MNSAFHKHHKVLSKLRSSDDHGKKAAAAQDSKLTSKQADDLLKAIRKAAVKAIHASCPSAHDDDDDEDEDEDNDEESDEDEDEDKVKSKKPASGLVLTGTPTAIAQQAAAAMDLVMNAVRTSEPKTESKGKSKKGGRD